MSLRSFEDADQPVQIVLLHDTCHLLGHGGCNLDQLLVVGRLVPPLCQLSQAYWHLRHLDPGERGGAARARAAMVEKGPLSHTSLMSIRR